MPYIDKMARDQLHVRADSREAETPGELNYQLTSLCTTYLETKGDLSYQVINDILGALEGAKLEFYRRVAAPYEDIKRAANGDVYP